jgi:hypothetical protein
MFPTFGSTDAHIALGAEAISPAQVCHYGHGKYDQEFETSSVGSFSKNINLCSILTKGLGSVILAKPIRARIDAF